MRRRLSLKLLFLVPLFTWSCRVLATSNSFLTPVVSAAEILRGRDKRYPLNKTQKQNLNTLLRALNKLVKAYGKPLKVSSGYRPRAYNKRAGGVDNSAHLDCMAVDFADPTGELDAWCMKNLDKLEEWGLWLEHPNATPTWTHLDIRPRPVRVFKP